MHPSGVHNWIMAKDGHHDFKIRNITQREWDLFELHCIEESDKRGKFVSCAERLREVIKILGSRTETRKKMGDDNQPELEL